MNKNKWTIAMLENAHLNNKRLQQGHGHLVPMKPRLMERELPEWERLLLDLKKKYPTV